MSTIAGATLAAMLPTLDDVPAAEPLLPAPPNVPPEP